MSKVRATKPRNLTTREWYCLLISSYFAAGKRDETAKIMRKGIKNEGLQERMFSELFLHLSLLLGFPTMLDAFAMLRTIAGKSVRPCKNPMNNGDTVKEGRKTLKRIYGNTVNRLLVNLKSLHDVVPDIIVRDVYGRIISRPGLSLREREIVNVVVLTIQHLDQQLYSHIRGALRLRVTSETLRSSILLATQIAGTDPGYSLQLLSSLSGSRKRVY